MQKASTLTLFLTFLKIGAFTFGGGYAMIPLFERELVHHYKYIKKSEFFDLLVIVQSLPGVLAVNFAVYVGLQLRGVKGAFFSALGVILPSFVIILVVAGFFFRYVENPLVESFFTGVRVSVVALIFLAGYKLLMQNRNIYAYVIIAITFILIAFLGVHPFIVIVTMGLTGYVTTRIQMRRRRQS